MGKVKRNPIGDQIRKMTEAHDRRYRRLLEKTKTFTLSGAELKGFIEEVWAQGEQKYRLPLQGELADVLHVRRETVNRWLKSPEVPRVATLAILALSAHMEGRLLVEHAKRTARKRR